MRFDLRNLFEMYKECTDSADVLRVQNKFLDDEKIAPKYESDGDSIVSEFSYKSKADVEELYDRLGNIIIV